MPLSFVRSGDPRIYLPGYRSMSQGGFAAAVKNYSTGNTGAPRYGEFDQGQIAKIESGRADLNANSLLSMAIKAPSFALEAPLRPFNVALGGKPGDVFSGIAGGIGQVPILKDLIGGLGNGLRFFDSVGGAYANSMLAHSLSEAAGKPDSYRLGIGGGGMTAGEARRKAYSRWSVDQNGNEYSLAQLEAKAKEDFWGFGDFATSEDGTTDFFIRTLLNPTNLLFAPGVAGAAVGAAGKVFKGLDAGATYALGRAGAANWAKPLLKPMTIGVNPNRFGYGYMKSMGRGFGEAMDAAHNPIPKEPPFLDVGNAARDVMSGNLRRSGYNQSVFQSMAWMGRGAVQHTFLPGLNTELKGAKLVGSAARAWMRGGVQQELALIPAEYAFGGADAYLDEKGMQNTFVGGTVNWIHDTLSKINNNHPLSDNDAYVMASLFLPFSRAAREVPGFFGGKWQEQRYQVYADNVVGNLRNELSKVGGKFKTNDEMLLAMGRGDMSLGRQRAEWLIDYADARKVTNQLSDFAHRIFDAEIDGFAARMHFQKETVFKDIVSRRKSGALHPKSTAQYMVDLHRDAGKRPGAVKPPALGEMAQDNRLSSQFTANADSFIEEVINLHEAYTKLSPQLEALGLDIAKGGIITKEIMDDIISHVERATTFDHALARKVIDMGPSLVYHDPFWREFSVTLGFEQKAGIKGRELGATEGITKDELLDALRTTRNSEGVPTMQELVHETIRSAKSTGTFRKNAFQVKEPPYPMGQKMRANQLKITGRAHHYANNDRAFTEMRRTEFTKSGQPRFGTAKEVSSPEGNLYKQQADGSYMRDDGVAVHIQDGAIRINIPASREADLMDSLNRTIFQSGKRRGQIKPGMEERSQQLNLEIEAVRMGVDPDALILATQNGGRVFVADPKAGPWLAKNGYVESARIQHRYPEWVDPGERPSMAEFDDAAFMETLQDDAMDDLWSGAAANQRAWDLEMAKGVAQGKLSAKDAIARGMPEDTMKHVFSGEPIPETVYHATTNIRGVRNKGMLTKAEMRGKTQTGLGGGPGTTVSFTDDPAVAERIAEVLADTGEIIRGEIPLAELRARAEASGFLEKWEQRLSDSVLEVYEEKVTVKELLADKFPDEPLYGREVEQIRYDVWRSFLRSEQDFAGKVDPYLTNLDAREMRHIQRSDVGVVKGKPAFEDAPGYYDASEKYLSEWKVFPEFVKLEGISERAAYSFRGGDPSRLIENSKAGAFAPYRPTKRFERSESAAIGVARGDARKASLLLPSDMSVGPPLTEATSMFPEERLRQLQEHTRATRNAYKIELQKASEIDEAAMALLPFDKKITDYNLHDLLDAASPTEVQRFTEFMQDMEQYPALQPTMGASVIVDPAADRLTMLQTTLNRRQQMFLDYGPLSAINRFYDALLAPKHVRWLGKENQNEVHNLLTQDGWDPNGTRDLMAQLRKEVLDSKQVAGFGKLTGAHRYPSVAALPEEKVRAIAQGIDPAAAATTLARFGTFQHMFTQASNRLLRSTEQAARAGGKVNKIEAAADAAFRTWQYTPGFRALSGAGQRLTKFSYPYFRFFSDPLFAAMNYTEPYVYNIMNNGVKNVRSTTARAERMGDLSSAGLIPPGGLYSKEVASDLILADPGFWTIPRNIRPNLLAEFELKTDKAALNMFNSLGKDHPIATLMRDRFGDDVKDWAAEMNNLMTSLVHRGPEHTTRAAFKKALEDDLGFSHAELKQLVPVAERLTEKYRGIYSDLADLYIGRMSRSNMERIANNYFIFWPVSYMVKVTGWAYRVMMEKIGPVQGNAGAWAWDQWRQKYERYYNDDSDFRTWTEDNPDFLFAMEMMAPITPASIGVSLNKLTRYAGNWVTDTADAELGTNFEQPFGEYQPETIQEAISSTMRFGPVRTASMASNILKAWEVPGFYANEGSSSPITLPP